MTTLIRVDNHSIHRDTGGSDMCLIKREKKDSTFVFDNMWYTDFEKRVDKAKVPPRNLTVTTSYYGGSVPSYQNYADQHSLEVHDEEFPVYRWASLYRHNYWMKGLESRVKSFDLIPIIMGDCSAKLGEVFEASEKMRYSESTTNIADGYEATIWNETRVIDVLGNGENTNGFKIGESGGTSWGTFNLWGDVTLTPAEYGVGRRRYASFIGRSDDQAIAINIFGNVTFKGNLEEFVSFSRAFSLIMVHDGATLTVNGRRGPRGCAIAFGSGKIKGI